MTDRQNAGGGHRLFFALWPQDGVRAALAQAADRTAALEGRRIADAKLHLTLHYLGGWPSLPNDVVASASDAAAAAHARAFHLVVDHAGGFPTSRVGWLAPSGNSGLDALWSQLGRALDAAGIARPTAPRFVPHITVRRDVRTSPAAARIDPISWPVDRFVLVHSHDGRYHLIGNWALANR